MNPAAKELQEILEIHISKDGNGVTHVTDLPMFIQRIQRLERSRVSQQLRLLLIELNQNATVDTHTLDEVFDIIDNYIDK